LIENPLKEDEEEEGDLVFGEVGNSTY